MIRVSTIYIGICMVLIATSLGVVLYSIVGIGGFEAMLVSLTALSFLILYHAVSMRMRDRSEPGTQIADLSRGTVDLARQMTEFSRRLTAVESRLLAANSTVQERTQTALDEINELGDLVRQLTATVALHDDALAAVADEIPPAAPAAETAESPMIEAPQATTSPDLEPAEAAIPASAAPPQLTEIMTNAIAANRVDLYLQPILTLPQRKVRFYEAMTRLRDETDKVITAGEFIDHAASAGLMGKIDHMLILRCMQVLRRLSARNKDVGVFCNIAANTLSDRAAFAQCIEFLDTNRAMAASFILEFKQSTIRQLGPIESEHLAALAQRGYRFSIDHVTDLKLEPRELADLGIRYIKVSAELLLDQRDESGSDIHPADLADLLGRFGIDLIAEKIESERAVVDLLDYDVGYGQGFLFAAPRPLRPENATASEAAPAAPPAVQNAHAPASSAGSGFPKSEPRLTGNAALVRRALSTT